MKVAVTFGEERLELEVPEDRLVAEWHGPPGVAPSAVERQVLEALERPRSYPPLRQAVVAGDRVVVALDADIECDEARGVLAAICRTLQGAGVEAEAIAVVVPSPSGRDLAPALPAGVSLVVHDPEDRAGMAYLATTTLGRRVYLNRLLTDADFVLPVGRLGYDAVFGYRGPWTTVFPGLSDVETARAFRSGASVERPDSEEATRALGESAEVSWLLGSQFHVGIVAGVAGPAEVVAGIDSAVRDEGAQGVDRAWGFRADSRAELVVAGIGRPGVSMRLEDLADGLATAARVVRRGGKIVALSRAEGTIGPALRRLIAADDPRVGPAALRGHEADTDFPIARSLARTLAWADVYLLSALDPDAVEGLAMIALDRPEEARRLVSTTSSCLVLSHAEWTRAEVADELEP